MSDHNVIDDNAIRTRFAPSPTGYMHIGNMRTALYTYLIAKKSDSGVFILRIEDTDQERQVEGSIDVIYKTLKDAGLFWDEGPDIGGPVAPYIQSERKGMHLDYAKKLVENDHAYYCFCTKERLDELHKIQTAQGVSTGYDGLCSNLTKEEVENKLKNNEAYVIRQKMPKEGKTTFHDEIFGDITVDNSELDDQIMIKSDGMPTYNFANVVDDHTMKITHVVRGNEYLSSAPKYNLLYEAFGWEVPKYVHVSPVMKDSSRKMSKRHGDPSYQDLLNDGYLTGAVLNYIALLGWSPKGEKEIFSLDELKKEFDIAGISRSPAIFDIKKLNHINGIYIKNLSAEKFHEIALPWIKKAVKREDVDTKQIASVLQSRTDVLSEIPEQVDFIDALPEYDIDLFIHKRMKTTVETSLKSLKMVLPILENIDEKDFTIENLNEVIRASIKEHDMKIGEVLWPLRTAVSGKQFTPGGGIDLCAILGKAEVIKRINVGIKKLENA